MNLNEYVTALRKKKGTTQEEPARVCRNHYFTEEPMKNRMNRNRMHGSRIQGRIGSYSFSSCILAENQV